MPTVTPDLHKKGVSRKGSMRGIRWWGSFCGLAEFRPRFIVEKQEEEEALRYVAGCREWNEGKEENMGEMGINKKGRWCGPHN